jgi:hypothetical protein
MTQMVLERANIVSSWSHTGNGSRYRIQSYDGFKKMKKKKYSKVTQFKVKTYSFFKWYSPLAKQNKTINPNQKMNPFQI